MMNAVTVTAKRPVFGVGEKERDEVSGGRILIGGRFGASDVQR